MKRALVIYYSQSGDVEKAVGHLVRPLEAAGVEVVVEKLEPVPPYPFPWKTYSFFDCMPEAVNGEPGSIAPVAFDPDAHFDLVVLGWQVWFLSPSLPVQAFLRSDAARVLRGKRVITLACCRQMWQRALLKMKQLVADAGGLNTDDIVLTHQGPALATFVTAPRHLMSGKRDKTALLPEAGVSDTDFQRLDALGRRLADRRELWADSAPAPLLQGMNALQVRVEALLPEAVGAGFFAISARIARFFGRNGSLTRRPFIHLYVTLLLFLLPAVLLVSAVLTPLLKRVFRARLNGYVARMQMEGCQAPQTTYDQ